MKQKHLAPLLLAVASIFVLVQTVEAGRLRRLLYYNYPGSWITNLYTTNILGNPTFPSAPDAADYLPPGSFSGPVNPPYIAVSATNVVDTYGSWIEGYLTAPETGSYTFWLSTDDEGMFFMTTDPGDPLNPTKTNLLCWVPGYSGTREWTKFPQQQSAPVSLEAGKTYYVEIFHKEGTGGDHIVLGWQTPSGALERPMPSWHFQPITNGMYGELDVEAIVGPVVPKGPNDPAIYDGMWAVVYANVNLGMPVTYQWSTNGVLIPGATNAYYLLRANLSDNNSLWTVVAKSGGNTYTSAAVGLYVTQDKPTVVSVGTLPQNPTAVQVVFSEDVLPATATNISNYSLPGATISSASLAPDGRTVILSIGFLGPTNVYTLAVQNVQDMATPANTMDPATASFIIAEGAISFHIWYTTFATDLASLTNATGNNSTLAVYTNNLFDEERIITTTSYQWNLVPLRNNYIGQMIGYVTAPETGQYRFAIASDDHSVLYLGTSELRSSKRRLCYYDGSTGRWNLGQQYANQQSALITLQAGKRYYIEAIYRDGTGGDGVTVCWNTPSQIAALNFMPTNNASDQAATEPFLIPPQYLSTFVTFGPVTLKTNLPATLSAAESTRPTLRVVADGLTPYSYQWYRSGSALPGATTSSYTLPFLRPADSGATFQVVVTNNFSSVTSVLTTLAVTADTTKPTVASVGSLFKQAVNVRFSEPITEATGTNTANYLLLNSSGGTVAVNAAILDTNDAAGVTLQTTAMPETDLMKLVVQNLVDLSGNANVMNPATNSFRANNFDAVASIDNTQPWSASADGDRILMTAGGSDIWGSADHGLFLYKAITGNFDYKVQGVSITAVDQWTKLGLMARATTAAGSRNCFNLFTAPTPFQNTYSAQIRDTTDGTSTSSNDAGTPLNLGVTPGVSARPNVLPYPSWVRLQRIGNTIYYYYGADGTNWTFWTYYDSTASIEGPLTNTLLVGLALTSHTTAQTADSVAAQFTAVNPSPLAFTLQPTNTTAVEGGTVTFSAAVSGNSPYFFQWLTNNIAMAPPASSATVSQTLTLTRVPFSLNGLQVASRVSNPYGETITSSNATLTVVADTNPPTVRFWAMPKINITTNEVKLLFSEPMNKVSAETLGNYQIFTSPGDVPLGISAAVLGADERTVSLTTANQALGTTYRVVVNNVIDQACCPPNPVAPNSTDYFFFAGYSGNFAQRADGYVVMEAENAQLNEAGTSGGAIPFQEWTAEPGFSGRGYMLVPNGNSTAGTGGTAPQLFGTGAKLTFNVIFNQIGRHIVWVRGWNQNHSSSTTAGNDDSVYIGFNDDGVNDWLVGMSDNVNNSQLSGWPYNVPWQWRSDRNSGSDPLTFTNTTAGLHRFIIWQREDGTLVDKVVLERSDRSAGNTAAPAPATSNGGLGDSETWEWIVPPPAAPTIAITNPINGQAFAAASNIPIETSIAYVTQIALVEFFSGTNLIGTATTAPYAMTWASVPEGIYSVTARVTDVLGYQVTSAAVPFVVDSTKPVAYAVGSLRGAGIGVYFSDLTGLDPATATNPANYQVNGGAVTVTSAVLEPDNLAVMLGLSVPIAGPFSVQVANVADRGFGPNVVNPTTLESTVVDWPLNQDVGTINPTNSALFTDPIMPGFAQAIAMDGFYVRAGGHDIWDNADGMHFLYLPVTSNFDVAVRVAALLRPDQWTKAGIMIREDLNGTSRNHLIAATPTNGVNVIAMQRRLTQGTGSSGAIADALRPTPSPIPNAWLRVTRTNDLYTFFWGTNGAAWTSLYVTNLATSPYSKVYVGLATTSHNNGTNVANMTSAYYRNVTGLAPILLSATAVGSNLALSWPPERTGMTLQTQVNPISVGLGVNWTPVPGSQATNRLWVPIDTTAGAVFYRLAP